jgi:hypothetical protein
MSRGRAPGFPAVGRTVPALALTAATLVVGFVGSWAVIGVSGWLIVSLLLVLATALVPRGPLAALVALLWGGTIVLSGSTGYSGRFVVALAAAHLLLALASLSAWLPFRSRVQLAVLRRPAIRYVTIQVVSQAVAFVVLALIGHGAVRSDLVWLGVVGAVAALALAALVLAPALLRPAR